MFNLRILSSHRTIAACLCAILFAISTIARPQDTAVPLLKIDFVGLQKVDKEHATAASGLKIGQRVTKSDLETANKQLLDSGLFTKSKYKYRQYDDKFEVTFQVEEAESNTPVIFDNFVWFTNSQLTDAVKQEIPNFDGNAPAGDGAIELIKKSLRRLLQDWKIPGDVDYTSFSPDISGKQVQHVFSVKGVNLPICAVHYQSTSAVPEAVLVSNSKDLLKKDYSVTYVAGYTDTLRSIYRRIGHLRASFDAPSAKLDSGTTGCITVNVNVIEGLQYDWGRPDWSGNEALTATELEKAMQMKPGEIADGVKIDDGIRRMNRVYGRKGYITARVSAKPTFYDDKKTVVYSFKVIEGLQYHMGKLSIEGLQPDEIKRLNEAWSMKEGDVYDADYTGDFRAIVIQQHLIHSVDVNKLSPMLKINRENLTVDVTISPKKP